MGCWYFITFVNNPTFLSYSFPVEPVKIILFIKYAPGSFFLWIMYYWFNLFLLGSVHFFVLKPWLLWSSLSCLQSRLLIIDQICTGIVHCSYAGVIVHFLWDKCYCQVTGFPQGVSRAREYQIYSNSYTSRFSHGRFLWYFGLRFIYM